MTRDAKLFHATANGVVSAPTEAVLKLFLELEIASIQIGLQERTAILAIDRYLQSVITEVSEKSIADYAPKRDRRQYR